MDFDLSEEQSLVKDSVTRLLRAEYGFEAREKHRAEAVGFSEKIWQSFAELGLLAILFDEEDGGLGAGPVQTMIVMEAFGRALAATGAFMSNILFMREAGYFAPAAELNPLIHTWSLAVEEQFYLLFPLLPLAVGWLGRRAVAQPSERNAWPGERVEAARRVARAARGAREVPGASLNIIEPI